MIKENWQRDIAMRKSIHLLSTITIVSLLSSCCHPHRSPTQLASNFIQRQQVVATTNEYYPKKNPLAVTIYNNGQAPRLPYRVIGVATISKHNLLGVQRQNQTMNNMMKTLAADFGGDGLINLNENDKTIQAHIIAYQRILI